MSIIHIISGGTIEFSCLNNHTRGNVLNHFKLDTNKKYQTASIFQRPNYGLHLCRGRRRAAVVRVAVLRHVQPRGAGRAQPGPGAVPAAGDRRRGKDGIMED